MRVLLVGASGAIGRRLIPQLAERGHQVTGTSRSAAKAGQLRSLGAEPAVLDVLDAGAVRAVVAKARPDAIVYQATALAGQAFSRNMDRGFAPTNDLRTKGADILLAAAAEAGVPRFIAQSFAPFRYAHAGGPVKDEGDPLVSDPPPSARLMFGAMAHIDQAVTAAGGIALRYGGFYGDVDAMVTAVRKRQFPLIGDGGGMMSFIHLEDAAVATVLALDAEGPAIFNITDDEPAPMRDWLPALAAALGAKPPLSRSRLGGPPVHGQDADDDDRGQGRVEREGHEGARLDPALPQLAHWLPRRLRPLAAPARAEGRAPAPGLRREGATQERHERRGGGAGDVPGRPRRRAPGNTARRAAALELSLTRPCDARNRTCADRSQPPSFGNIGLLSNVVGLLSSVHHV